MTRIYIYLIIYSGIMLLSMNTSASALPSMTETAAMSATSAAMGVTSAADVADYSKMSALVRRAAMEHKGPHGAVSVTGRQRELCAFVRVDGSADSVFSAHGCRSLARFGDIHIASVPLGELRALSLCGEVRRIEAGRSCTTLMDSTAGHVNALPAYEGRALPQAYTGRGVVMGIMDVGFDLTHPNFYDSSAADYRIARLWDQLSADIVGSGMYVGAEYVGHDALLGYAHSRDGLIQTHGTHTLGIAAGSGYDSPYRGMAWESDICLVNNAVTSDIPLIDKDDLYKYTYATDALGFKYIFDHATAEGKPCVISFSEGSHQDLRGDDMLYYEILDSLVGPGRIIVASAGNDGYMKTFMRKPDGRASAGTFVAASGNSVYLTVSSSCDLTMRLVAYGVGGNDTLCVPFGMVQACDGGEYADTVMLAGRRCAVGAVAYASCYDASARVCDLSVRGLSTSLDGATLSVELLGHDAEAEMYLVSGTLYDAGVNPLLCDAEYTHSIHSPASAPAVICVGATVYRTEFTNYRGDRFVTKSEGGGVRGNYSSVGPTLDGRIKPDVMAPGTNVISSYSSYYMEANPEARDLQSNVALFGFGGRTYPWTSNAGTSMSAPVVGGAVALWLQACPDLTPEDVMGVISRTARRLDNASAVPNNMWGYGEIDVYGGLLDILGVSAISGVTARQPVALCARLSGDNRLCLSFDTVSGASVCVSVYSLNGVLLAERSVKADAAECSVGMPPMAEGVYVVRFVSADNRFRGSTLVRKG